MVALALLLGGCSDPYAEPQRPVPSRADDDAEARAIAARFCRLWTNWRSDRLERHRRKLAELVVPGAGARVVAAGHVATDDRPAGLAISRGRVLELAIEGEGRRRAVRCLVAESHTVAGRAAGKRRASYDGALRATRDGWLVEAWGPAR